MPGFIPLGEAERLLAAVDAADWRTDLQRRVQHYGWRYDYRERRVAADMRIGPLPDWLAPVVSSVGDVPEFQRRPDQVIVNEYLPGQGISGHVDCEPCFGPVIASLSLTGHAEMVFRRSRTGECLSLILEPLMLVVLSAEARYEWTHEIPARKSDHIDGQRKARTRRVSLTFRTVTV